MKGDRQEEKDRKIEGENGATRQRDKERNAKGERLKERKIDEDVQKAETAERENTEGKKGRPRYT